MSGSHIILPPGVHMAGHHATVHGVTGVNSYRVGADAFSNPLANTGFNTGDMTAGTQYPMRRLTQNYSLLNSLYRDNWLIQNIVNTFPNDMCKKRVTMLSQIDPHEIDRYIQHEQRAQLWRRLNKGLRWGSLYGGAAALILINRQYEILEKPLDYDLIMPGDFQGLHIIDRWSGISPEGELVTDPGDPDFGKPAYYKVQLIDGRPQRVHHSRVIRFTGNELPYWEEQAEQQWGASEVESIYDDLLRRDNIANNITKLTYRANLITREVENLDQTLGTSNVQMQERFWTTMAAQGRLLSNDGMLLIEKGGSLQTHQYTFSGLAEIYATVMMDLSGATHIPVSKLFGRSISGLGQSNEGDIEIYASEVESRQEMILRPILERLVPIMALSVWGKVPSDLTFKFNPTRTAKAETMAKIAKDKEGAISDAFNRGLIDQGTAMKELRAMGPDTAMFSNITDETIAAGEGVWVSDIADKLAATASPSFGTPSHPDNLDDL